ncbi:hypothetical protein QCA50_013924 [Cerrena zonata]|uniref:Uncharacterized protein n=1 Tax=Cerrena zonata TaxID=2478898 RepID=A0AAW0FUB5_9APHY
MYNKVNDETKNVIEGLKFDQFSDDEKTLLISGIDNILHFIECGCTTSNQSQQCAIYKIKKATSYLLRSTRKASNISNVNLSKSREELIRPKKSKQFISWDERLIERDRNIQQSLISPDQALLSDQDELLSIGRRGSNETLATDHSGDEEEADGGKPSDNEKENENVGLNEVKKKAFGIPFKQQLIAKGRQIISSIDKSTKNQKTTNDNINLNSELIVPIVQEVVVKIKQLVEDEIKPIQVLSESPKLDVKPDITNTTNTTTTSIDQASTSNNIIKTELPAAAATIDKQAEVEKPSSIDNTVSEAKPVAVGSASSPSAATLTSSEPAPPPVVKKLSFADYKKKMK